MKAETIAHLWNKSQDSDDAWERIKAFARACEQRAIERAKELYDTTTTPGGRIVADWSVLDAVIAKENES